MASIFGHAFSAIAFSSMVKKKMKKDRWLLLSFGMLCAIFPDVDVISFKLGIPYSSPLGHRGFTHSLLFAFIWALLMLWTYKRVHHKTKITSYAIYIYFALCTMSHGLLDALTSGGRGVGFFIPFDNERYFFPFRPIRVSPIGIDQFFSEWGWQVILSELVWIGIPGLLLMLILRWTSK